MLTWQQLEMSWVVTPFAPLVQAVVAFVVSHYYGSVPPDAAGTSSFTSAQWQDIVWKVRQLYLGQIPDYTNPVWPNWTAANEQTFITDWKTLIDKWVARYTPTATASQMNMFLKPNFFWSSLGFGGGRNTFLKSLV